MAYITPVTDRAPADIVALNSKAYWNVADWERVYNNSYLTSALASIMLDTPIAFTLLTAPTIATIPAVADFNTLLTNIENARIAMIALLPALTEIKDNWQAGANVQVPNYTHANQWETTIDAIWDHWNGDSLPVCPILSSDLTVLTGTNAIYVDCLDLANFNADVQGTGNLYII